MSCRASATITVEITAESMMDKNYLEVLQRQKKSPGYKVTGDEEFDEDGHYDFVFEDDHVAKLFLERLFDNLQRGERTDYVASYHYEMDSNFIKEKHRLLKAYFDAGLIYTQQTEKGRAASLALQFQ